MQTNEPIDAYLDHADKLDQNHQGDTMWDLEKEVAEVVAATLPQTNPRLAKVIDELVKAGKTPAQIEKLAKRFGADAPLAAACYYYADRTRKETP